MNINETVYADEISLLALGVGFYPEIIDYIEESDDNFVTPLNINVLTTEDLILLGYSDKTEIL